MGKGVARADAPGGSCACPGRAIDGRCLRGGAVRPGATGYRQVFPRRLWAESGWNGGGAARVTCPVDRGLWTARCCLGATIRFAVVGLLSLTGWVASGDVRGPGLVRCHDRPEGSSPWSSTRALAAMNRQRAPPCASKAFIPPRPTLRGPTPRSTRCVGPDMDWAALRRLHFHLRDWSSTAGKTFRGRSVPRASVNSMVAAHEGGNSRVVCPETKS